MPKSQFVDPDILRRPSKITFTDIDVNAYNKTIKKRAKSIPKRISCASITIWFIREFETMLYSIKTTNSYNGINYNNPGPAHLQSVDVRRRAGICLILTTTFSALTATVKFRSAFRHRKTERKSYQVMEGFFDGGAKATKDSR